MTAYSLRFGTARAAAGRKVFGKLHVKEGGKSVSLPVCAIHGARPGRHVLVLTNQHGGEINGIESVRRFCAEADPRRITGTICAVISSNPRAAMAGQAVWSEGKDLAGKDGYHNPWNMYYNWPGKTGGKLVERMTYEIWNQAIQTPDRRADFVLDIHAHVNPTAVYADDEEIAGLGVAAGVRHIVLIGRSDKAVHMNLICHRAGIPCMTLELSKQGFIRNESVQDGLVAIRNLLKFWGLLPGKPELPDESVILDPWRDHYHPSRKYSSPSVADYICRHDGLVVFHKGTYQTVRKGEAVCSVLDPFSGRIVEECRAPITGGIYNYRTGGKSLCHKGQCLYTLGIARKIRPQDYVSKLAAMRGKEKCQ